jgi:hypothetical protein
MSWYPLLPRRAVGSPSSIRWDSHIPVNSSDRFIQILSIWIAAIFLLLTFGCGSGANIQPTVANPQVLGIHGQVHGGQQPITGSTIQLYQVGTTGDGSAATPLIASTVKTDSSGDFNITGDYVCPTATTEVYLGATGGNPGLTPGTNNSAISMVAALGQCGNLSSSTYVFVNEATTVGTVFPFASYMKSYSALGSGNADALTFDNLFSTVNEFVNTTNGTSPGPSLPAGDDADTAKLYTLSDIVAACINSPGGAAGDGSPCGNLFSAATPPATAAPTDIVGALIDIANNPTNNVAGLFALAPSNGPFQPTVPLQPADWSLSIEPSVTVTLPSGLVGNGNTLTGTLTLSEPAPSGGLAVTVISSTAAVTIGAPTTINIPAAATAGTFTYSGIASGAAVIQASAPNYISGTANVTSTNSLISLGAIPTLAPGQTVSLPLSLGTPAPAGGVTVNFTSGNNALATISPASVFISAGLTVPTANPQVTGVNIGATTITATGTGYAPDVVNANVTVTAAFNPGSISEPLATPTNLNLNISAPAPVGGITFTLLSANPGVATVPAAGVATIAAGATSVAIPITGVSGGTTTISASSPNITTATATVNVGSAISVGSATVGQDMQSSVSVSLATTPTSPITVTVSSNAPGIVLVSKSATAAGTITAGVNAVTFTNVTTSFVGTVYVQGQALGAGLSGSATITAAASSGYANGAGTITVNPSGFVIYPSQGNITTTTLSSASTVTLQPAILTPGTLAYAGTGALNPGAGPLNVPMVLGAGGAAVGTISTPVVFNGGDSSDAASFTPVGAGTTTIGIQSQPAGFSAPSNYQQISATVSAPATSVGSATVGEYMQSSISVSLATTPVVPVTVVVTSGTPGTVLLSKTATAVGTASVTFTNVTSTFVGTVYVQGQNVTGTSTLTAVATNTTGGAPAGYTNGTGTITVNPSGFVIYPSQGNISTTTFSTPTTVTLTPAILTPGTLAYAGTGALDPGAGPFNVPMVLGVGGASVGTISTPVVFNGGDSSDAASFTPVGAGSTTIGIQSQPAGFSTPSNYQQISATVSAPTISVGSATVGEYMQSSISVSLATTPVVPVTVTVTSGTPGTVLVSKSATSAGTIVAGINSVTFTNVTSTFVGTVYVQGQNVTGTSTLTAVATNTTGGARAGYTNGAGTITVNPSGFVIYPSQGNISTTTFSTPTTVTLTPAILTPGTLAYAGTGALNPGIGPFNVPFTSSLLTVGTISTSPVVFNGGDSSDITTFQPVASGTTTLAVGAQPAGFSTPANYQSITAAVSAPNTSIGNATIGANMQTSVSISLAVAPPSPVTVTVTSNAPGIATISNSGTVVGGTSLTFTNVTSTFVGTIYVQGQTVGSTTITVAAPGYNNSNGSVSVMPSGFVIYPSQGNMVTTSFASPTTVTLQPAILNPGLLTYAGTGALNPGIGPFNVVFGSSNTSVGTITTSPVVFAGGSPSATTAFQPVGSGNATLSIGAVTVAGGGAAPVTPFSIPSQYESITAAVTAPNISVGSATIGANMQGTVNVSLGTAPVVPVNVTVTSSTPGTVLVSKSASAAGTIVAGVNSITFTSVTSTNVGTVYVQGQSVGSTTITATAVNTTGGAAAGYNSGTGTITVDPSGFIIYPSQGNINTTSFSSPTTVTLEPAVLNPGVLTYAGTGPLNPGIGPFDVTLTPNPIGVGTITTSPVVFNPTDPSDTTAFQPVASGTTTLTIGTPTLAAGGIAPPAAFSLPSQYQSITATVTAPNISVGSTTVGQYMQGSVSVSLGTAPPVPVTVTITSSSPNVLLSKSATATGASSVSFTSVTSTFVGTVYVQGQGSTGTALITAVATNTSGGAAAGYNNGSGTITVDPSGIVIYPSQGNITATPQSSNTTVTLEPAILNPGILTYAGTGALNPNVASFSVPITSSTPGVGTLSTASVLFTGGASSATTTFQPGTTSGTTTIAITDPQAAPFSTPSQYQSITATVSVPNISIGNTTTGVNMESSVNLSLGATPLTPVTVTVTSNGPSIVSISNSAGSFGQNTVTFNNVTSTNVGTIYVQGQSLGTTTLTVTASGYNTGSGTVTVNPSGFIIYPAQGNISTTPTSSATSVTLEPAILNPGILTYAGTGALNPGIGPFNIGLTSSNTTVGTLTTSPVVFHGGDSSNATGFQPGVAGSTTLTVGAQPAGFSTPSQYQQITANVTAALGASIGSTTTGVDMETQVSVSLGTAPAGIPVTVTITNGTGSAVISNSAATVGAASYTFPSVSSTYVGAIWVQGLTTGTATLTVSAPGYTSGTSTVTIDPSGFIITSGNISTTTFSSPTAITLQPAILNPGILTVVGYGQLSPGIGPFTIDLDSQNGLIGTVTTSPVSFSGGATSATTSFQPVGQGTTTLTLGGQPVPFSTPSQQQYVQITASVVAPNSSVNNVVTGVNMEAPTYIELGAAPSGTVGVNVSIANSPASAGGPVAVISTSPTAVGAANLILNATTSTVGPIYVQGLTQGTAIITVTFGSEYNSSTGTVTVNPSGFIISSGNITTTPTSSPTTVTVAPAVLTPGILTFYGYGQLSPGAGPYNLAVTSGSGLVGAISTSPVVLNPGDTSDNTTFVPAAAGVTTITLGAQPAGFSTPSQSQYLQVSAAVVSPNGASIGSPTTGVNMQTPVSITLGSTPSAPINVTVTSATPAVATVSGSASVAGAAAYTFNNVTSQYVGTVYVQGQTAGTSTLTVTNTGAFATGTGTATVDPSGFVINSGNILTNLSSSPSVMVVPAVLNPGVDTVYSYGQLNPGIGPYNIALTSSNLGIGTISTSPVAFAGGATTATTSFQPVSAGTTTLSLGAQPASGLPGAFTTPSQYQQVTATVTGPGITVGNVITGVNMENPLVGITLSVAPSSPITVTVTTNGPAIATVSNGSLVVGGATATFTNVSTTNVGTIWVQGQSLGSTTLTVSAPGYSNGIGLATVDPSGFVLQTGDFATLHTSPSTTIPIYAAVLAPTTLDYLGSAQLNPGLSVSVPFTSSNLGAGSIVTSPIVFNGGDGSDNASFQPNSSGSGTTTLMLGTPAPATGFSTPSQTAAQQIIATVD